MDAYDKLRPWTEIEACKCASVEGLFVVDLLTDNPLHCDFCRKEVDPERLKLTVEETESVARWFSTASALYRLWLDSGESEEYAKARLLDPNGQVNRDGLHVARTLPAKIPTRFWFFRDTDDGEPTHCPICLNKLDTDVKWGTGMCLSCRGRPILICHNITYTTLLNTWSDAELRVRAWLAVCEALRGSSLLFVPGVREIDEL